MNAYAVIIYKSALICHLRLKFTSSFPGSGLGTQLSLKLQLHSTWQQEEAEPPRYPHSQAGAWDWSLALN